jgi:hypothetical protein
MTRITFIVSSDYGQITPVEWLIPSKHVVLDHGVDRDHYRAPGHLIEREFEKMKSHYGERLGDVDLVDTLIATKDRRIMQLEAAERRAAA